MKQNVVITLGVTIMIVLILVVLFSGIANTQNEFIAIVLGVCIVVMGITVMIARWIKE